MVLIVDFSVKNLYNTLGTVSLKALSASIKLVGCEVSQSMSK